MARDFPGPELVVTAHEIKGLSKDELRLDRLSLFNRRRVRYLGAGGYAAIYYTYPRYTNHLDFVIALMDETRLRQQKR